MKHEIILLTATACAACSLLAYASPVVLGVVLTILMAFAGLIIGLVWRISCSVKYDVNETDSFSNVNSEVHTVLVEFMKKREECGPIKRPPSADLGLEETIGQLLELAMRDLIIAWFRDMLTDESRLKSMFLNDLWAAVDNFNQRVTDIDKTSFLTHEVVDVLTHHFSHIRHCSRSPSSNRSSFHPCLLSHQAEMEHIRRVADIFVVALLPTSYTEQPFVHHLLREILTHKVLSPAIELICDPFYLNSKLHGWLKYRQRVMDYAQRRYHYAATYEEFMAIIKDCSDIEQLKAFRYAIISELVQATFVKDQKEKGFYRGKSGSSVRHTKMDLLQSRDIDRYINQLKKAKTLCVKRMQYFGGPSYSSYVDNKEMPKGWKLVPLTVILETPAAKESFISFLHRTDDDHLLRFCELVETMKQSKQSKHQHHIARDIYRTYVLPQSSPLRLQFEKQLIASMDAFLQGKMGPEGFWKARDKVYHVLEERFYPSFMLSDVFQRYVKKHKADIIEKMSEHHSKSDAFELVNDDSEITAHLSHANEALQRLHEFIVHKTNMFESLKEKCLTSLDEDGKQSLNDLEKELFELNQRQAKLESHIDRTETWMSNFGNFKVHIFSADSAMVTDGNIHGAVFTVVVSLISEPQSTDPLHQPCGWVLSRSLQDFATLHNELVVFRPSLNEVVIPRTLDSCDVQTMEQTRIKLQTFLNRLLGDSVLANSEPVYEFFISGKDLVKQAMISSSYVEGSQHSSFFKRLLQRAHSTRAPVIHRSDDESTDEVATDSFMRPLYQLLFEVFDLTGIVNWLPRTLVTLVRAAYGKSINRQVKETVQWIYSEPMLIYYIQLFRDAYWPHGKLADGFKQPTMKEQVQMRYKAKKILLQSIPDAAKALISEDKLRMGVIKVFEAFQDVRLNKHLFYTLLEHFMMKAFSDHCQPRFD